MSIPAARIHPRSGAFTASDALSAKGLASLNFWDPPQLQDVRAVMLLLRGESAIDWSRLDLRDEEEVARLLRLNGLDISDPADNARLEDLRERAGQYATSVLKLKLMESVLVGEPAHHLPLLASSTGLIQRHACAMLKIMHIMHHIEARELRTFLSVSDTDLHGLVEDAVVGMFDEMRSGGLPVSLFEWSRKTRESQVTKLLAKKETLAVQIFDRLRFRLTTKKLTDIEPTLKVLLQRCIPFNFVVPGQTVNSLVSLNKLEQQLAAFGGTGNAATASPTAVNTFSSQGFRVLNFCVDLPIRVDDLMAKQSSAPTHLGRVVFVLAEFQVMDEDTAALNESGPSAHAQYKARQIGAVKERLFRTTSGDKKP